MQKFIAMVVREELILLYSLYSLYSLMILGSLVPKSYQNNNLTIVENVVYLHGRQFSFDMILGG